MGKGKLKKYKMQWEEVMVGYVMATSAEEAEQMDIPVPGEYVDVVSNSFMVVECVEEVD